MGVRTRANAKAEARRRLSRRINGCVHLLQPCDYGVKRETFCGIECWPSSGWRGEADTALCNRLQYGGPTSANCRRCIAAATR